MVYLPYGIAVLSVPPDVKPLIHRNTSLETGTSKGDFRNPILEDIDAQLTFLGRHMAKGRSAERGIGTSTELSTAEVRPGAPPIGSNGFL